MKGDYYSSGSVNKGKIRNKNIVYSYKSKESDFKSCQLFNRINEKNIAISESIKDRTVSFLQLLQTKLSATDTFIKKNSKLLTILSTNTVSLDQKFNTKRQPITVTKVHEELAQLIDQKLYYCQSYESFLKSLNNYNEFRNHSILEETNKLVQDNSDLTLSIANMEQNLEAVISGIQELKDINSNTNIKNMIEDSLKLISQDNSTFTKTKIPKRSETCCLLLSEYIKYNVKSLLHIYQQIKESEIPFEESKQLLEIKNEINIIENLDVKEYYSRNIGAQAIVDKLSALKATLLDLHSSFYNKDKDKILEEKLNKRIQKEKEKLENIESNIQVYKDKITKIMTLFKETQ